MKRPALDYLRADKSALTGETSWEAYDSQTNRVAALARGISPVIPRRENSKQRGRFFPRRLYKLRARVEQAIGKLKGFKRVAMRCDKTDISYSAIISFACGLMPTSAPRR